MDKICNICNLSKNKEEFKGRHKSCKLCRNKKRRESRLKNDTYRLKNEELIVKNEKLCKYCNKIHSIDNFRKNRLKCIDCEKLDGKSYRKSDIGKQKSNDWINKNTEHYKKLQSDWYQNNKSTINQKNKLKLDSDPIFKLLKNYRRRLNLIIKKEAKTLNYLNCSKDFLLNYINYYLESNDELTLNNYGTVWHIDHVIPISKLDLNNKKNYWCLEWFNLAPLKSEENLKKNNNIDKLQIKQHLDKLKEFININKLININIEYIATYLNYRETP